MFHGRSGCGRDESSPYRNTLVSVLEYVSCLVLSCGVLWCGVVCCVVLCVLACVCWRAAHSPQFPSKLLELNSFIRHSE